MKACSVSYKKIFENDCVYTQRIRVRCTEKMLVSVNKHICEALNMADKGEGKEPHSVRLYCKPFTKGRNYCGLTQLRLFVPLLGMSKRTKRDRNTIVDVELIK